MSPRRWRVDTVEEELVLAGRRVRIVRPRAADELLEQVVEQGDAAPYWADLWPSGRALAAEVAGLDLTGVRALELGCGVGVVSMAASMAGATVVVTDRERQPLAFAAENVRRVHGRRPRTLTLDFADTGGRLAGLEAFELVLAADVLYEAGSADALAAALRTLVAPGGRALVAYPWRGQADALRAPLAAEGWRVDERVLAAGRPGTSVRLLSLGRQPPATSA